MRRYLPEQIQYEENRQNQLKRMLEIKNMMNFLGDKLDFDRPRIYGPSLHFDESERLRAKLKHHRRLEAMEAGHATIWDDEDLEAEGDEILEDIRQYRLEQFS